MLGMAVPIRRYAFTILFPNRPAAFLTSPPIGLSGRRLLNLSFQRPSLEIVPTGSNSPKRIGRMYGSGQILFGILIFSFDRQIKSAYPIIITTSSTTGTHIFYDGRMLIFLVSFKKLRFLSRWIDDSIR